MLAELTDPAAVRQAIAECDARGRDAFLAHYGFQQARDWILLHEGREYDSKAIAGVAYAFQYPERGPLRSSSFTGGLQTTVSRLRALGFEVRRRRDLDAGLRPAFDRSDCALFARYPRKVPFTEEHVPAADKARFKSIRDRLKAVAQQLAAVAPVDLALDAWASSYSQNGRSPTDLWACAYPAVVPNKSYGLELALILSEHGAELCFCLGAGHSQLKDAGARASAEAALAQLRNALRNTPSSVQRDVEQRLAGAWDFRRRWREPAGTRDFDDLGAWLAFAAGPEGSGASISRDIGVSELAAMGPSIADELLALAHAVAPLIEHAYAPSRPDARPADLGALAGALHLEESFLREIVDALEDRGQVILYGPPGTGKTYVARKLAEALAPQAAQREIVQFHPSYSYEDFVVGYRPFLSGGKELGYRLEPGPLLRLAQRAAADPEQRHLLLVDEINRGNLPRIFGELLYLLEYRDERISLMYAPAPETRTADDLIDEHGRFALPRNLWLIGTMNTADRSIGLIDAALRRRFHFIPFFPGEGALDGLLARWLAAKQPAALRPLAGWVDQLNARLRERFGRHLQVGHSYFMRERLTLRDVERIWAADIMPFLEDQLFDQDDGVLQGFALAAIRGDAGHADDPPD